LGWLAYVRAGYRDSTNNESHLIPTSKDKLIKIWDLRNGKEINTLIGHSAQVNSIALMSNDRLIISASDDRTIKVWSIETGEHYCTLIGHIDSVENVVVTPDNKYIISSSRDNSIKVWDVKTQQEIFSIPSNNKVEIIGVTKDSRYLIFYFKNSSTIYVFNLQYRKIITSFSGESSITSCKISADGITIIIGEESGKLHFLQLTNIN
jgi:WD40 repeat protein